MAQIRYSIVWVLFGISSLAGMALLLSPDADRRGLGVVLLLAPMLFLGAIIGLYYWKSRRDA